MRCKIQQLGVRCLWPIKTTMALANQNNNGPHGEPMTSPAILWRRDDTLQSAEDDTLRSSILWRRDEHIETRRHIAIFWRDRTTNLQEQTTNGCPATPRGGGRCETTKMHALRSLHSPIQLSDWRPALFWRAATPGGFAPSSQSKHQRQATGDSWADAAGHSQCPCT